MAELTLNVTRGAVQLLQSSLMRPGWAKDTVTLYRAGAILETIDGVYGSDPLPRLLIADPKEPPKPEVIEAHTSAVESWAMKPATLMVSAKDYEVCKTCISMAVGSGSLMPTKHYMSLAEALGLNETPGK